MSNLGVNGYQQVATPASLPATVLGTDQCPSGQWAKHIMGTLWAKARNARFLKTPLLRLLATMTELREPLLRPTHVRASHWTPLRMHEMIGNEAANVESAMIQVVGRAQDAECDSCLRDHGPWAQCVVLDGPVGLVCGCANCHWDSNDSRCTSFGAGSPDGTPATYRQFPPAGPNQPRFAQSSVARLQVLEGHHPVPTTSRHDQSLGTSTNAAHQAVESNRPATTSSSQHQAITQSSATSPQDI